MLVTIIFITCSPHTLCSKLTSGHYHAASKIADTIHHVIYQLTPLSELSLVHDVYTVQGYTLKLTAVFDPLPDQVCPSLISLFLYIIPKTTLAVYL